VDENRALQQKWLQKLVVDVPIPEHWIEGEHFEFANYLRFNNDEMVVIGRSNGAQVCGLSRFGTFFL